MPCYQQIFKSSNFTVHFICVLFQQTAELEGSGDKTFVVSAQSPMQRALMAEHATDRPVFVEGGYTVWLRSKKLTYFVLQDECTDRFHRFNAEQKDANKVEGQ